MDKLPGDLTLPSSKETFDTLRARVLNDNKYKVEDFFKNPEKTSFKISPDGTHISYLAPYKRRKNIFIRNIKKKSVQQINNNKWGGDCVV